MERDPLQAAGLFSQDFVASQSKVSTFSFVAPCLVGKFLAVLPVRDFRLTLKSPSKNRNR
jgi:hypothetical protein